MTIYIQIPILPNNPVYSAESFSERYFELTGEIYKLNNMKEEAGIMQMTGSSRCTEEQAIQLKQEFPMMNYYIQMSKELPFGWIEKIENEPGV